MDISQTKSEWMIYQWEWDSWYQSNLVWVNEYVYFKSERLSVKSKVCKWIPYRTKAWRKKSLMNLVNLCKL